MLHDLANDDGFVALKWASKDRGMETERRMSKTFSTAEDYWTKARSIMSAKVVL